MGTIRATRSVHNCLSYTQKRKEIDKLFLSYTCLGLQKKKKSKVVGLWAQGRQNAFSGAKLEFLESYKNQFNETRDHGPFYMKVSKAFIERFGYNLAMEVNPEPDDDKDLTPDEIDTSLPVEEQNKESNQRSQFYRELREKLGCWYRYRYTTSSRNATSISTIIDRITSSFVTRPRKKASLNVYSDKYKSRLKPEFDLLWKSVKGSLKPRDRIRMWNEHLRSNWERELPEVRESVMKETEAENERALGEWKKKATFTGSAEDLEQ
ncbi:hypothetical protein L208DRAFT_1530669 [Tricholoma matsutake]|nr:hypothetical protein L208DRAFT_1530669 [Tricholoma matsutake 945]